MIKIVLSLLFALVLTGCSSYSFLKNDEFNKKIDGVKQDLSAQIEAKNAQIIQQQVELLTAKEDMSKEAAGHIYGALTANYMKISPDRIDSVERVRMEAAFAKLPTPDAKTLIQERQELVKELDEKNTTLAQLEQTYKEKINEAAKQKEVIAKQEEAIKTTEKEKIAIKDQASKSIEELRVKQDEANKQIISNQQEDIKAKEAKEKLIRILIYVFTGVGVAVGIIAYLLKSVELAGFSAISIGLAILVAFMQPWQIVSAVLVMFGLMWLGYHRKYNREKQTKLAVIGAVQERKVEDPEGYNNGLKKNLEDWFKNDPKGEKNVEQSLKELNLK